ncbi:MAG: acetyltransferase [Paludisphaera borealis]|uniref:acetyltransferase n=1 Tax=Paludisphaera borealis TaxID=1387353 RepID=UPI00284CC693|nr:acetyltransferase [Paludisphaera borealis]MDR3619546.1 acetyltransferase [Paludisphaera borealis]
MTRDIRPLQSDDLDALSRFLTSGFNAAADADFAAPEVLRWKYLESMGDSQEPEPRSYIACDESGAIVGHLGICPTAFTSSAIEGGRVPALHMIDWLGSPTRRGVGVSLMRKVNEIASVQFGLGGSRAGRDVAERSGYELLQPIWVYQRMLRPARWARLSGLGSPRQAARIARDLAKHYLNRPAPIRSQLELVPASTFGAEVADIASRAAKHAVLTERTPERLNYFLRFPRQAMSGFIFRDPSGRTRGFALLNMLPQPRTQIVVGKVVDCLLDDADPDLRHAASLLLSRELTRQGADVAEAYTGAPWTTEGLRRAGYVARHPLDFHLRDPKRLIPRDRPFHFTPIEGDYAYT